MHTSNSHLVRRSDVTTGSYGDQSLLIAGGVASCDGSGSRENT